ncbi:hypothetical protein [Kutzneria kofuensis]|uniref:Small secreted protein n=1 Tax=Kutzneria kofuensis TaxID=103725 RepID=A0A7W9NFY6_9PSEU|nr:hypothetical protein [Kutzneria kofuensis]MBB5891095.1 hypothetical protein [Kutzneria kofuensis]
MIRLAPLLSLLLIAACAAPPPAPDPDAPAIAWAAKVCGATPQITLAPRQTAPDLRAFLDTLSAALTREATAIRAAGPPPVPDGQPAVDKALGTIDAAQKSLHQAGSRLAEVPPGDDAALQQAVADVNAGMGGLADAGDPKATLRQNSDLDRAFDKAEGC